MKDGNDVLASNSVRVDCEQRQQLTEQSKDRVALWCLWGDAHSTGHRVLIRLD